MGEIRPFGAGDVPAVADLFQRTFRRVRNAAPQSLRDCLTAEFLNRPGLDPEIRSLVYLADGGTVRGFIGVHPVPMLADGRAIRAAVAGSLMAEAPQDDPLAGARLLRSFVQGPQDLSFSETANPLSQGMWAKLGGRPAPTYSMEWLRVLKPGGSALAALARTTPWARFAAPAVALADRAAAGVSRRMLSLPEPAPGTAVRELAGGELAEALRTLADGYRLRPAWEPDVLDWLIAEAARKERFGAPRAAGVYGRKGDLVGLFLYHSRPGGIARVLQLMARAGHQDTVIASLLRDARAQGCSAVRGRTQPDLLDALLRAKCLFVHRASTVAHSRTPELLPLIDAGSALITGLAAETWSRLIGGTFA